MDLEPSYLELRQAHGPELSNARERGGMHVDQAMLETQVPEDLRKRLTVSFFQTADWMRNKGV